jgi:hypothetical protein
MLRNLLVVLGKLNDAIIWLHPLRLTGRFEEGTGLAEDVLMNCESGIFLLTNNDSDDVLERA